MPKETIFIVSGLVVFGALLAVFGFGWWTVASILLATVSFLLLRMRPSFLAVSLVLSGCALGFIFGLFALERERCALPFAFDKKGEVWGTVSDDVDVRASSVRVTLTLTPQRGVRGCTIIASLPPGSDVHYGDSLTLSGTLTEPETFETGNNHEFPYPEYLRAHGVHALLPRASLVSREEGSREAHTILYEVKHAFDAALERALPEPHISLLEGLLLGEKRGMSATLLLLFTYAGLMHAVVLSGYNLNIVAEAVLRVSRRLLPRTIAFAVAGVLVCSFALMVGGGAATVRALLMGMIALLARYLHRSADALRALAIVGAAMLAWNPHAVYDPGFILSIAATFGLITLAPLVERRLTYVTKVSVDLSSILASTIAVQLFVLPLVLYYSGYVAPYALIANILFLPLVPPTMLSGALLGGVALCSTALAQFVAFPTYALLSYLLGVVRTVGTLPGADVSLPAFSLETLFLIYVPFVLFASFIYLRMSTTIEKSRR